VSCETNEEEKQTPFNEEFVGCVKAVTVSVCWFSHLWRKSFESVMKRLCLGLWVPEKAINKWGVLKEAA